MNQASRARLVAHVRSRKARIILGSAIILLSIGFLAYFIYRNWNALSTHEWTPDYAQLAMTLLFHLIAFIIAIGAWHSMIGRLAGSADWFLNARIYCYSAVARRLPGVAWDIATRVAMYDHAGLSIAIVGVVSILEWIIITLSGILLYVALTPFTLSYVLQWGMWPLLGAAALGSLLIHPRLIRCVLHRARKGELPAPLRYRDTLWWLFLYAWTWIVSGLMLFATVRIIYPLTSSHLLQLLADWILVGVLTSFASFVPTSMALKEVTLTLLMSRYMPEYIAVVAAILMRVLTVAYSILWTLCSTQFRRAPTSSER